MKKKLKLMLFSLLAIFVLSLSAQAEVKAAVKQTACSNNSVTITWDKPNLSGDYTFLGYCCYTGDDSQEYLISRDINTTKYTFNNQKNGMVGRIYVKCYYRILYSSGNYYDGSLTLGSTYVNTRPVKLGTKNFGVNSILNHTKKASFRIAPSSDISGFDIDIDTAAGKNYKQIRCTGKTTPYISITQNTGFKYRVRMYYKNYSNNTIYTGDWSSWKYFNMAGGIKAYTNSRTAGIKLTIPKSKYTSKYVVYISTNKNKGFKKVATVTPSTKKSKSIYLKKYGSSKLKKGKTYYVKVQPYVKSGSKKYKSDIYMQLSARVLR